MDMHVSPNFTPKSQQLIIDSKIMASSLNHSEVTESHLLVSLLRAEAGFINEFIRSFGLKVSDFIEFVIEYSSLEELDDEEAGPPSYGASFKSILSGAYEFSNQLQHSYIGVEHLFFCLINNASGASSVYLHAHNVPPSKVIEAFLMVLKTQDVILESKKSDLNKSLKKPPASSSPSASSSSSVLDSFCIDLNDRVKKGSADKIIGKDVEINRLCEILGRKIKNNPLLLGEPGVGKTAVVEGLAERIESGKVPNFLAGKTIYSVDLGTMIAGTKYRGQFEQRLTSLIKECSENPGVILFIDEVHTLVGAGSAEGTLDAANMLKPYLSRGDIKLIGATTFSEFKKSIEKDSALSRRFETIPIEEPSADECYRILKGVKSSYESFHSVKYPSKILRKIVSLCDAYLPHKNFPDKAIDVLDEVGARVKIKNLTPPPELVDIETKIYGFIDSEDSSSEEEGDLLRQYDELMLSWESSLSLTVTVADVLSIVSVKAKLPESSISEEKDKKSANLSRLLNRDVINQKAATSCVHKSILRSTIGLREAHQPIGSFLFLGSTGVGKTLLAKSLSKHYFGSEKNILRLDMSEYSEKVSSSKLVGASPGYVGYEEGGILIERLKKTPHCVILFDEIEKAHPSVQQLLLQILEEGEIEDNSGTKAYFKDSIVILTSNIGASLTNKVPLGFAPSATSTDNKIKEEAKSILSPELVNRLDEIVVFNPLDEVHLLKILKVNIRSLSKKLRPKNITLTIDEDVSLFLCSLAADENMGARPLKRLMQSEIEDKIVSHYYNNSSKQKSHFQFSLVEKDIIYTVD
jgi:ATP-dependent Clp protease ATP-binding subunit ClpC